MSGPFKMKGSPFQRNFGIGPNVSPYKAGDDEKSEKPEKTTKEYGTGEGKGDKGWVKAAKAATTMLSHGLAGVYGGTAHTPRINWGKKKSEIVDENPGKDLAKTIINGDDSGDGGEGNDVGEVTPEVKSVQDASGNLNEFYKASGQKVPSVSERQKMWTTEMDGDGVFTGTAQQNAKLLQYLKNK